MVDATWHPKMEYLFIYTSEVHGQAELVVLHLGARRGLRLLHQRLVHLTGKNADSPRACAAIIVNLLVHRLLAGLHKLSASGQVCFYF